MVFIDQLIDDMRVSENEAIILWEIYIYIHNGHNGDHQQSVENLMCRKMGGLPPNGSCSISYLEWNFEAPIFRHTKWRLWVSLRPQEGLFGQQELGVIFCWNLSSTNKKTVNPADILENISHDGSMVLLYMVTWIPLIYPLYVSIYTSTMDPSWVWKATIFQRYQFCGWVSWLKRARRIIRKSNCLCRLHPHPCYPLVMSK